MLGVVLGDQLVGGFAVVGGPGGGRAAECGGERRSVRLRVGQQHPLSDLGEHRQAAELHQQVLAGIERALGPDHPFTLTSRNNLATALSGLGEHRQAAELHQQVLADRERVLGPDHPTPSPAATTTPTRMRGWPRLGVAGGGNCAAVGEGSSPSQRERPRRLRRARPAG
ncbi:tetratricopeptide repeat protein [Streptomyces parvus]|uniref:tetratricopeptide repeat protein n=1 Tax=Streptomyces parvus TaxID=66428 RepID=UPI0033BC4B40